MKLDFNSLLNGIGLVILIGWLLGLTMFGGIIYLIIHFASKFW